MRRLLLAATCALLLVGCFDSAPSEKADHFTTRWHDPEYRVVCWTRAGGGISCLPDAEVLPR